MKANLKSQSSGNLMVGQGPMVSSKGSSFSSSSKMPKTLTEHKSKRLSILTSINEHKHILFTKKAFKHEKEKIWRQIFTKMLDFGMVSKEKDWRYVRDVSFSNWRKRAQKRMKLLAANGYRLNFDECEFLIYDILGKTPDKSLMGGEDEDASPNSGNFGSAGSGAAGGDETTGGGWTMAVEGGGSHSMMMMKMGHRGCGDDDDDESDEYMIDSDEDEDEEEDEGDGDEDEDDADFDERLFVPKIVFSDGGNNQQMAGNHETLQGTSNNNINSNCNSQRKSSNTSGEGCSNENSSGILKQELMNKGKNNNSSSNGVLQRLLFNGNNHQQQHQRQFSTKYHQNMNVSSTNNHHQQNHHRPNHHQNLHNNNKHRPVNKLAPPTQTQTPSSPKPSSVTFANNVESIEPTLPELDLDTDISSPNVRYVNKFRELRLLDLEIENKVLKNRYMKLKIFQLEDRLGVEHCKEVKEFKVEVGGEIAGDNGSSSPSQSIKTAANEQTTANNGEQQLNLNNHKVNNVVGGPSANKKART